MTSILQANKSPVNDLVSGGLDKNLSAEQGKVLKNMLDAKVLAIKTFEGNIASSVTGISYTSMSSLLGGVATPSTFARDNVFRGWGESFSPAGISFNAIRLKQISRTSGSGINKWRTLNIVVRTGLNLNAAGATVVAIGTSIVNEASDYLTDIVIVLKDPITGEVKTLTNADFQNNQYFIGVHAKTATDTAAACGEPRGTISNSLLQSYYYLGASNDPVNGSWSVTSGGSNARLGFEHLLLEGVFESDVYAGPNQTFVESIYSMGLPAPELVVPSTIYGVVGRECNLYLDNIHVSEYKSYVHDIVTTGSVGTQQEERWTWVPSTAISSTSTLTVDVYNPRNGVKLTSKTCAIRSAATTAQSGVTKKILVIGDSLVNAGIITQTLLDIVTAGDPMPITLLGTQGTGLNKHEGRGGWTVDNYTTAGPTYYDFTVSGVVVAPAINATEYTNNGSTYRVQVVNLVGGAGTLRCSVTSGGAPSSSGILTKSNGSAGDSTISFSASSTAPGNPFYIGGAINFNQYLINNSINTPDWVVIALGINDVFGITDDAAASTAADAAFLKLDTLITSIKAAGAAIKVGLMLPSPPSYSQDSFGANYGSGQTRWRFKRNILIWSRQLLAKYAGQEASRVYIAPTNVALDTVNNMNFASAVPVNSRSSTTIVRQNNGVHPGNSGYQQIADALFALIKYIG